jgi:hypothetical protein
MRLGEPPPTAHHPYTPVCLLVCSHCHSCRVVCRCIAVGHVAQQAYCMRVLCGVSLQGCFTVSVNSADCTTPPLTPPFRSTPFPPSITTTFSAKPTTRMPIPRGRVTVAEMERRVHGKPTICLVITSPESRDLCMLPAEDDFGEWKRALKLIGSVSTLRDPNTVAGSQRTVVVGEPVASWPPEDGRTWSPESAVRAVAAEAALAATDPDGLEVWRLFTANDKTTASMASSEGVMDRATMSATPTVLLMGWGTGGVPGAAGLETWERVFFVLRESTEEEIVETSGSTHMLVAYKTNMDARVAG